MILLAVRNFVVFAEGNPTSLLDGVPITIKDEFALAGYNTRRTHGDAVGRTVLAVSECRVWSRFSGILSPKC